EDGIRDFHVTGVQTCALPISHSSHSQRDWQAIGAASGIGCSVVVSLLLCIGGGVLLDRWLGTSPVMVLIGMVAGLIAAGYSLYEDRKSVRGGRSGRRCGSAWR